VADMEEYRRGRAEAGTEVGWDPVYQDEEPISGEGSLKPASITGPCMGGIRTGTQYNKSTKPELRVIFMVVPHCCYPVCRSSRPRNSLFSLV